jgi:hypothetical protein
MARPDRLAVPMTRFARVVGDGWEAWTSVPDHDTDADATVARILEAMPDVTVELDPEDTAAAVELIDTPPVYVDPRPPPPEPSAPDPQPEGEPPSE